MGCDDEPVVSFNERAATGHRCIAPGFGAVTAVKAQVVFDVDVVSGHQLRHPILAVK